MTKTNGNCRYIVNLYFPCHFVNAFGLAVLSYCPFSLIMCCTVMNLLKNKDNSIFHWHYTEHFDRCNINCREKVATNAPVMMKSNCSDCTPYEKVFYSWSLYWFDSSNVMQQVNDFESMTSTGNNDWYDTSDRFLILFCEGNKLLLLLQCNPTPYTSRFLYAAIPLLSEHE